MRLLLLAAAVFSCLFSAPAAAEMKFMGKTTEQLVTEDFVAKIREWIEAPVVRMAVESQNERLGDMSQDEIDALDQQWRAETEAEKQPLIASVLFNPLSTYLTRIGMDSIGLFTEIIVTDKNGLNVGQSGITGDFWQGDEAKYLKTYAVGPNQIFIDDPEVHSELALWRAQVNMTIHNDAGEPIGAATVEVNMTELARRRAFVGG